MAIFRTSRAALLALPVLFLGACDNGGGTAAPTTTLPSASATSTAAPSTPVPSTPAPSTDDTRCHTADLRASVGRLDPGAGQKNFPVVLTNDSDRTCTLRGYPGAAFVDAAGKQLGPDPKRSEATPTTVELAPGGSAWAGLSFANPEISEAETATPAALLVTPPDERESLKVPWDKGEVPVGGNESSVFLTVFGPGSGA
ncbi:DUF4232 domain-containing protein [Streptomyces sp. NPDC002680]|uniref:DUF4232 domain-containing protein n=1 Tax=Streptomyces sp. NPDC002680 TaxID=3364659 RepID=UPI003679282F